ncbi:urease accessory protein UreF [Phyllobacterium leguminum]|uniref:Urease accessory protein UreF n=1 Tax=Phyllobacterium leguminum TaxID=314237 RepID=A0A318T3A7_9HYPH|nr:urease accessory protein UreF [Phyllobacterium leguminum]PYE87333.1 urease accessory protein [Phyllobacterium leguminum]
MSGGPDTQALLRLMAWLSPAFPVGAFSYSGGLEQAVHDGRVCDRESLRKWLVTILAHGAQWNDAVLLAEAYRACDDAERLHEIAELAEALAGSAERHRETMLQGEAFLTAASAWPHPVHDRIGTVAAYPVAVGAVAGAHETGLEATLAAYLHASASNLVSVAIRCGVIGQRDGVAVLTSTEASISDVAARAAISTLDDLGSVAILADIASLAHETLVTRLFRS